MKLEHEQNPEIKRLIISLDVNKEFIIAEDGYVYYWPQGAGGCLNERILRIIADELEWRNAEWDAVVKRVNSRPTPPQQIDQQIDQQIEFGGQDRQSF